MKIFLDTNVVVDYLAKRAEYYDDAALLFELINRDLVKAYVSSLTVINCAYVMRKFYSKEMVLGKISDILQKISITAIDEECIKSAINSRPYDFEDRVQYQSACEISPDMIITRDKKLFKDIDIQVMTPHDFIFNCRKS